MSNNEFDWDKYFAESSWNDIRENSPFLNTQRLPSLVNQKAELVYLSSIDLCCSISDTDSLDNAILHVKSVFQSALKSKNYYKAAIASSDFDTIKNMLSNIGIKNTDIIYC
ncbi:MAG: hypothetical protein M0003_18165 [Acidithiobacillus sp.]|nr:hypothetical protein [Acidithiobacillus sp.]